MPPKAAQKEKGSAAGAAANKNWEADLIKAQLEEVCSLTDYFIWADFCFLTVFIRKCFSKSSTVALPGYTP